jgi:hypothetical protein
MGVKPYQWLAWLSTAVVLVAAILASFKPELYLHHYFFIIGNSLWILVGFLWRENSLLWFNIGLTVIYILGLVVA